MRLPLILSYLIGSICCLTSYEVYSSREIPNEGPQLDTAYIPGQPGAEWSEDEIETTRVRILQAIHPDWEVLKTLYGKSEVNTEKDRVTENKIMRLVFHDCVKYTDGTGGCDGCLNWKGVGAPVPNNNAKNEQFTWEPLNLADNNGLGDVVRGLEKIYTTIDWPFKEASLTASLQQSGKSRADLWQFAGLVALERAIERANRACDLDKWGRQQVTFLEGRDACEIKIKAPLKFWSGRSDCTSTDKDGKGYMASKEEAAPRLFGDARHITDFIEENYDIGPEHSQALQAVHGAVHQSKVGVKYTWIGPGYISNMYYRAIANKATYAKLEGDIAFGGWRNWLYGDTNGQPYPRTGWRSSCFYTWNTPEGGPCFLRPVTGGKWDAPNKEMNTQKCVERLNEDNSVTMSPYHPECVNARLDENRAVIGADANYDSVGFDGPWKEGLSDQQERHNAGWSNEFGFPWELSSYWNFTTSTENGQRAIGCPGLDQPYDEWPFRNNKSPIKASYAMNCTKQDYKGLSDIVEKFATDQQYWSVKFFEAWDIMQQNGYPNGLTEGPFSGWFGSYSLKKQGRTDRKVLKKEMKRGGIVFTDPEADPFICGHGGHASRSCGYTFSYVKERALLGLGKTELANGSGQGLPYDPSLVL